ncbi:MAG: sialidase family protein [Thermoplasmatota archaeon]
MKWSKLAVLLVIATMVMPLFIYDLKDVEGGKPIFRSNILAVWDNTNYNQRPIDMEVDHNGRIYITYTTDQFYFMDTYLVYSDDDGITWSSSHRIDDVLRDGNSSNDRSSQLAPRMAIASNNTVYVVWADERDKTYIEPQTRHIRIAWSKDGENFSRSVRIDPIKEEQTWEAGQPDIAINQDGRIFVAWLDQRFAGAYDNVWTSYSDDGGATWSDMQMINDDGLYYRNHEYARCVMQGDDVYVTWQDKRGEDNQYRPYMDASHDGGETFGVDIAVSDDMEQYNSRQWPSPALDEAGNLYVTWRDKRTANDEIWFARSEDKGVSFSTNIRLAVAPEGSEDMYPYTAATGIGGVGVVFQRSVESGDITDDGEIFYINSSDGGRTWDVLMRVDDTDRYSPDTTMQEKPLLVYDNTGRAISTWADHRYFYSKSREVYFSAHSGPVDGPNHRPIIYDEDFWSTFQFNPKVGSSTTNITFSCNYSDHDNDVPIEGYPRIHIYGDEAGNEPVFNEPKVMNKVFPNDIDYMDGAYYLSSFQIPVEGQTYFRIEVIEERDPEPLFSSLLEGPLIDATPPKLTVISPANGSWHNTETIFCKVRVEDFEGGNVQEGSIKVRKSINDLENLEKGVALPNKQMIDNNTYEAWGNVRLDSGTDNYVVFEAKDKVGNGPGLSVPVNIWIDPDPPYYTGVGPTEIQLFETVNCTIQWLDHFPGSKAQTSGLNISSIEFAYRTTSGPLTEWAPPEGMIDLGNETYHCWVNLQFPDEGVYSFIKWRAKDNLDNVKETGEFRIKVDVPDNYRPIFLGKGYPDGVVSPRPHLFWDAASDIEGDTLYYRVMLLKYPGELQLTHWIDVGERTFYDIPDDDPLDPGYYILRVNVSDKMGGYDYDTMDHLFRIMDKGTPPPEKVPRFGPFYSSDSNIEINWSQSPSHTDMDIHYMIRMGSKAYHGDILEWTDIGRIPRYSLGDLNLDIGIYSIQIMVTSNYNYSRVTLGTLKINDYNLSHWSPLESLSYRGYGRGFSVDVVNYATFSDNVTITLEGYLAEEGAAYLDISGSRTGHLKLSSQKILSDPEPIHIEVTVFPDEDIEKRDYKVRLRIQSEDGRTVTYTDYVTVEVKDKPRDGFGQEISDNLYDFLTDTLPFLKPVRQDLLVPLFLVFVAILVTLISGIGILIYRKKFRKVVKDDPYSHQRKLYRDLYGVNPSDEQLKRMEQAQTQPSEDDFFSEIPDIGPDKDDRTGVRPQSVRDGNAQKEVGTEDEASRELKEKEEPAGEEDLEGVEEKEEGDYMDPDSL